MALYGSDTTIPYQPRREPYYNGQMAPSSFESGIDIGDYVARRIVPVMLGRSDRPLQLVMNLGHLELEEPPQVRGSSRRHSSLGSTSNAIIYNAPGSTMSITGGLRRRTRSEYNGYQVVNTPDDLRLGPIANRRIGTCLQCCRRQLIAPSGYCTDCETSYGGRGPLTLVARSGMDRRGWDGVRYIGGSSPMRRTSDQWERDRNRDSLLPGYYTDSDIGWRRS